MISCTVYTTRDPTQLFSNLQQEGWIPAGNRKTALRFYPQQQTHIDVSTTRNSPPPLYGSTVLVIHAHKISFGSSLSKLEGIEIIQLVQVGQLAQVLVDIGKHIRIHGTDRHRVLAALLAVTVVQVERGP